MCVCMCLSVHLSARRSVLSVCACFCVCWCALWCAARGVGLGQIREETIRERAKLQELQESRTTEDGHRRALILAKEARKRQLHQSLQARVQAAAEAEAEAEATQARQSMRGLAEGADMGAAALAKVATGLGLPARFGR